MLDALKKGDEVADLRNDRLVLTEIKAALTDFFNVDDALDAKVRRKIASLPAASRRAPASGTSSTGSISRKRSESSAGSARRPLTRRR